MGGGTGGGATAAASALASASTSLVPAGASGIVRPRDGSTSTASESAAVIRDRSDCDGAKFEVRGRIGCCGTTSSSCASDTPPPSACSSDGSLSTLPLQQQHAQQAEAASYQSSSSSFRMSRRSESDSTGDPGGGAAGGSTGGGGTDLGGPEGDGGDQRYPHPQHLRRRRRTEEDDSGATTDAITRRQSLKGFIAWREEEERDERMRKTAEGPFFCRSNDDDDDESCGGNGNGDDGPGWPCLLSAPEGDSFFNRSSADGVAGGAANSDNSDRDEDGDDDMDGNGGGGGGDDRNEEEQRRLFTPSPTPLAPEMNSFFCRSVGDGIGMGGANDYGGGSKCDDNEDEDELRRLFTPSPPPTGLPERDSFFCRSMTEDSGVGRGNDGSNGSNDECGSRDVDEGGTGSAPAAPAATADVIACSPSFDASRVGSDSAPAEVDLGTDRQDMAAQHAEPKDDGQTQRQKRKQDEADIVSLPPPPSQALTTPKAEKKISRRAISFLQGGEQHFGLETPAPRTPSQPLQRQRVVPPPPPASYLFSSPEKIRPLGRPLGRVASAVNLSVRNSIAQTATPVRKAWQASRRRGSELIRRRRARRAARIAARLAAAENMEEQNRRRRRGYPFVIIPADHPVKMAWDVLTVILTIISAYHTHQSIRDRTYEQSPFVVFIEFWFVVDILLNFVTEHKTSDGQIIRDGKAIWARYLTSWFVIDAISIVPWERIYVRPIVERQKRRNIFTKTFFRSKAVVRVTRLLRGRHLKLFGKVAKQSKQVGVGGQRLLRLIIKYVPKYLLFYRNMRSVLVVRSLRLVHFLRKLWKQVMVTVKTEPMQMLRRPGIVFAAASADWSEDDDDEDVDFDDDEDDDGDDYLDDEEYFDNNDGGAYVDTDGGNDDDGAGRKECQVVLLPKLEDPTGERSAGVGGNSSGEAPTEPVLRFRATAKKKRDDSMDGQEFFFPPLP